jgi:hypothetical protein
MPLIFRSASGSSRNASIKNNEYVTMRSIPIDCSGDAARPLNVAAAALPRRGLVIRCHDEHCLVRRRLLHETRKS